VRKGQKTDFARTLRSDMTEAEKRLWYHLRQKHIGARFRRQVPIASYVVDFLCIEAKLVVEVDGSQHLESQHDITRDAVLIAHGYRVLRFWNHDVLDRTQSVLEAIWSALREERPHPAFGHPPPQAGEGTAEAASAQPSVAGKPTAEQPTGRS
jgi:very-short-patch-repair endonuclease